MIRAFFYPDTGAIISETCDPLLGKRGSLSEEFTHIERILKSNSKDTDALYALSHECNHFLTLISSPLYIFFPISSLLELSMLGSFIQWHKTAYPGRKISVPLALSAKKTEDGHLKDEIENLLLQISWLDCLRHLFWDLDLYSIQGQDKSLKQANSGIKFLIDYFSLKFP